MLIWVISIENTSKNNNNKNYEKILKIDPAKCIILFKNALLGVRKHCFYQYQFLRQFLPDFSPVWRILLRIHNLTSCTLGFCNFGLKWPQIASEVDECQNTLISDTLFNFGGYLRPFEAKFATSQCTGRWMENFEQKASNGTKIGWKLTEKCVPKWRKFSEKQLLR